MQNYKTLLQTIGNTPIVRLDFPVPPVLLAKLEFLNPGGSVKDRAALFMIEEAEASGKLKPGGTIVEASSGNQGIALAMIGKIKGYKVIITVPDRTAIEKVAILRAYGAQVHICPNAAPHGDPNNYHTLAVTLSQTVPGAFMPNQYFNKANPLAHYTTTGPEIWGQTNGTVTHVVMGAGSCGTISGAGRYLKEKNQNIKIIGVDAESSFFSSEVEKPYNVEGLGIDQLSDTFNSSAIDTIIPISDKAAFSMTRRLAEEQGILVGISSGAVMQVALNYANRLSPLDVMVVILADSGKNYLSKIFFQQTSEVQKQNTKQGDHAQSSM